ncbi:hypothetical protein B0H10DRAFT_1940599 [Mycena sp. CBHHK59/15]|nr:hypothetical protein B0H10DRAFT_1940599 [Mycena sp. CBHHK59/15]
MSQVVQTLVDQDVTAGGFSLRALRTGHDGPPCMLAVPSDFNHNMLSRSEYQQSIPISESFLTGNRAQLALAPAVMSLSTVEFRAHHRLGPHVNLYEVHIVQPPFQSNNVIPFLESRYAYERDLLGFLPLGGFGAAYVHYTRYCILS